MVTGGLRLIGRLASGDSPTTQENADLLIVLNEVIDSLSVELGPIFSETLDSLTWTGGSASMSIGASGDFNVARPQKILSAFYRFQSVNDYALKLVTHQEYQQIVIKGLSVDFPQYLAYNPTFTNSLGTLFIWPIPVANATIRLNSFKPLGTVAALSDTITLPPGYQEMLRYNLAVRFGAEYGLSVPPEVAEIAAQAKFSIARLNDVVEPADIDPMAPGQSSAVDYIRLYTQ